MEPKASILIVDDETVVRDSLGKWFEEEGYFVETATSAKDALLRLPRQHWDLALVDIKMPGMDGLELQRKVHEVDPEIIIIIMTGYASVETAVQALKDGAYDYITKPFDPDDLAHVVTKALEHRRIKEENVKLREKLEEVQAVELVGQSRAMQKVLESELFGHERGAFTGAQYRKKGKFEVAEGGSVFLDEIADISLKTQTDLLRVLQEKEITRVGGNQTIPVDFRAIAATNKELAELVKAGTFRPDLYYRLNVFGIEIPPLRERKEDIPLLADYFIRKYARAMNKHFQCFSRNALEVLMNYSWPGNVRELENAIERAMVIGHEPEIQAADFPLQLTATPQPEAGLTLEDMERAHILRVLEACDWNQTRAAKVLQIDRVTLYNKIKRYGFRKVLPAAS